MRTIYIGISEFQQNKVDYYGQLQITDEEFKQFEDGEIDIEYLQLNYPSIGEELLMKKNSIQNAQLNNNPNDEEIDSKFNELKNNDNTSIGKKIINNNIKNNDNIINNKNTSIGKKIINEFKVFGLSILHRIKCNSINNILSFFKKT